MIDRYDDKVCEPFRAWNRLEPRARQVDFDRALRTQIHDPLWALGRQWQFGEMKGEDTGSAILAKVEIDTTRITHYQPGIPTGGRQGSGNIVPFDMGTPLERTVEAVPTIKGYKGAIRAGQHFVKLIDHYGTLYNDGAAIPYNATQYRNQLIELFGIEIPEINENDSDAVRVQKVEILSNTSLVKYLRSFAASAINGTLLYLHLKSNLQQTIQLLLLDDAHYEFVQNAVIDFIGSYERLHPVPSNDQYAAWNQRQLEYQFSCALPEREGENTVLCSDEYYTGDLDWYAFDVAPAAHRSPGLLESESPPDAITRKTFTVIPTEASYAGMPNNRWWAFEDGKIDLGNLSPETTDIAKIIVAEYALVYGNDWFVIPCPLPVGSLSTVNGIIVTDVFGQSTLINPAIQGESDDWSGWGMFNLHTRSTTAAQSHAADTRLFLPPTLAKTQESSPIEEVAFVRDEMANMVWAIETRINNLMQAGMDGHTSGNTLHIWLHGQEPGPVEADETAVLKYILSNTVPENWVPFSAVHHPGQNRSIQLQRASMPRLMDNGFIPIRPRTAILRFGIGQNLTHLTPPYIHSMRDQQSEPYFINEEEVPRAGVIVKGTYQRARWFDGKVVNWYGYRKQTGRGQGGSGLQFDAAVLLKKNKPRE